MSDPINPDHYRGHPVFTGECYDVTQYMDFVAGNAIKYLWRHGRKDDTVQDLRKALWYVEHLPAPNISIVPQHVVDRMQAEADAALDGRDSDLMWCTTTSILNILNRRHTDALDLINIAIGKAGQ